MLDNVMQRIKPIHNYVIGAAWFFIVASVLHLTWVVASKWGDPGGAYKLYHTVVDGVSYDAFALTYTGWLGLVWAMLQGAVVIAATLATVAPWQWAVKHRRIGHLVLCSWAALWMLNLMRLAGIDHQLGSYAQSALLTALFGATAYRAILGWSPRHNSGSSEPRQDDALFSDADGLIADNECDPLQPDDVSSSAKMSQVSVDPSPAIVERWWNKFAAGVKRSFTRSKPVVQDSYELMRPAVQKSFDIAKPVAQGAYNRAKPVATSAWSKAKGLVGSLVTYLRDRGVFPKKKTPVTSAQPTSV